MTTLKLALIGSGIAKSRMPRLQQYLGQLSGIELDYRLIDAKSVANFDPSEEILRCQRSGYRGVNITHPFKQVAWRSASSMLETIPNSLGACNTLRFEEERIVGTNTDYSGFVQGYNARFGSAKVGVVLQMGAGGVGRAIAFALVSLGLEKLYVFDTNPAQAQELCRAVESLGVAAQVPDASELNDVLENAEGLVNCTPLGMYDYPGSAFPLAGVKHQKWAFDAVYTPLETEFLAACRNAGVSIMTGFDLWLYQGVDAFNIFTGANFVADETVLREALSWLD